VAVIVTVSIGMETSAIDIALRPASWIACIVVVLLWWLWLEPVVYRFMKRQARQFSAS
jgi:hypothetical protein